MEKPNNKKLVSLKISKKSKKLLDESVLHMKLRKNKAYEKLIADLRDPEIKSEFFKFTRKYKVRRITFEPIPVSIYISEEMFNELDINKYQYGFNYNSLFFKYLFYFYYQTNIGDVGEYVDP